MHGTRRLCVAVATLCVAVYVPVVEAVCDTTASTGLCATCPAGFYGSSCETTVPPRPLELIPWRSLAVCCVCSIVVLFSWSLMCWGYATADELVWAEQARIAATPPTTIVTDEAPAHGVQEDANQQNAAATQETADPHANDAETREDTQATLVASTSETGDNGAATNAAKEDARRRRLSFTQRDGAPLNESASSSVASSPRRRGASVAQNRMPPKDPSGVGIRRRPSSRPSTQSSRRNSVYGAPPAVIDAYGPLAVSTGYDSDTQAEDKNQSATLPQPEVIDGDGQSSDAPEAGAGTLRPEDTPDRTGKHADGEFAARPSGARSARRSMEDVRTEMEASQWADYCRRRDAEQPPLLGDANADNRPAPLPTLQSHGSHPNRSHSLDPRERAMDSGVHEVGTARSGRRRALPESPRNRTRDRALLQEQHRPGGPGGASGMAPSVSPFTGRRSAYESDTEPYGSSRPDYAPPPPRESAGYSARPSARSPRARSPTLSVAADGGAPRTSRRVDPATLGADGAAEVMPPLFGAGDVLSRTEKFPLFVVDAGGDVGTIAPGDFVAISNVEVAVDARGRLDFAYELRGGGVPISQKVIELYFAKSSEHTADPTHATSH